MTEKETITKIKAGDEQAFQALFERLYGVLCAYLKTYTADRHLAEELVQKSFFTLWQKRNEIEIHSSLKSYLFTMARNNFLQQQRSKKKENQFLESLKHEAILEEVEKEDEELQKKKIDRLKTLVESLPPRCKEVLLLKQKGLKYQEIAEELNISIKSVESQMRIAFQKIKAGFSNHSTFILLFRRFL